MSTPRRPSFVDENPAPHPDVAASAPEAGFDRIVERLRGVVEKLEAGNLTLEQSLAAFEEGVRLSRRGAEILDRAEERVEQLTHGGSGESARVAPVGGGGDEGAGGAGA
jgi:exodeoxyribonuclease VII small subunit